MSSLIKSDLRSRPAVFPAAGEWVPAFAHATGAVSNQGPNGIVWPPSPDATAAYTVRFLGAELPASRLLTLSAGPGAEALARVAESRAVRARGAAMAVALVS